MMWRHGVGYAAALAPLSLLPLVWRWRRAARGTALADLQVGFLEAALGVCWSLLAAIDVAAGVDHWAWYGLVGLLLVLAPMQVLGARRPTTRVWHLFVMLPLALVLGAWPLTAAMVTADGASRWTLEEPLFAGYCLALLMGVGNFCAWPHTLLALGWAGSAWLIVAPACPGVARLVPEPKTSRLLAALMLPAAAWLTALIVTRRAGAASQNNELAVDRAWRRFRELFGVVWARRVQDAFNDQARRAGLPWRLAHGGLVEVGGLPVEAATADPAARDEATRIMAWLLQKFVDDAWLARHLAAAPFKSADRQLAARQRGF